MNVSHRLLSESQKVTDKKANTELKLYVVLAITICFYVSLVI